MVHAQPVEPGERRALVGRWPVDAALGIISAFEDAGIRPRAERTGTDVALYVRDDEQRRAHRVLTSLAGPADHEAEGRAHPSPDTDPDADTDGPPRDEPARRARVSPETASPAARPDGGSDDEVGRPLLAERMRRLGRPLAALLAVLIAITLSYQGPVIGAVAVAIAVVGIAVWLRNRVRDDDITYGDD